MSIVILKPGLMSMVQDLGRTGYQKEGVATNGAMDSWALRMANILVGNQEQEACLEITLVGPSIRFEADHVIAITGGDLSVTINRCPVPLLRPVLVNKGSILTFGQAKTGCRAYLAFSGGIDVPIVLGSKSTYLRAGLGGYKGRVLDKDDIIQIGEKKPENLHNHSDRYNKNQTNNFQKEGDETENFTFKASHWFVDPQLQSFDEKKIIRIIPAGDWDLFTDEAKKALLSEPFKITSKSDRMGYRLEGPLLETSENIEMISESVALGTIQVPADGQPIILLHDRQTTGGYPKMANVITADIPKLAQVKPGDSITFSQTTVANAQELLIEKEQQFHFIKRRIELKLREGKS